jgi:hypothetical protein
MKKNKTIIFAAAALMIAASFVAIPKAKAADLAPGEGAYLGAFMGFGAGVLQTKVTSRTLNDDTVKTQTFETDRGGLGLEGIQGGGYFGYGIKTADDIYIGAEIHGMASDEKIELSTNALKAETEDEDESSTAIASISAKRQWSAGGALRVGYYVNPDTLFALKGGIAISQIETDIGGTKEQYLAGGPQFGGTLDTRISAIDPNLSLRMETTITNYLTADFLGGGNDGVGRTTGDTGYDGELTGIDVAARIGVTYNFDIPSMF